MFDKSYEFRGTHAEKVHKLTIEFDQNKNKIFERVVDVYKVAPIIGFLYGRKAELDKGTKTKSIFLDQIKPEARNMEISYRLIMLLDTKHEPNFDERINKAFRYYGSTEAYDDEELYEEYVRGGVDILYEKLLATADEPEKILKNLYDFLEEIEDRYNREISTESILELCRLASI